MAAADIWNISSSPPRHPTTVNMSSSPLPSPSELFSTKPGILRNESQHLPISPRSTVSFTTTSSLLRNPSANDNSLIPSGQPVELGEYANDSQSTRSKPRKATTKKTDTGNLGNDGVKVKKPRKTKSKMTDDIADGDVVPKAKAPRKPRAKKAIKELEEDDVVKAKPARKPRAKKADGRAQTIISGGQVTKPSSANSNKGLKGVETVSKHFPVSTGHENVLDDSVGHGLAPAVRRRIDWTPPPTTGFLADLEAHKMDELPADSASNPSGETRNGFSDLLGRFGAVVTVPIPLNIKSSIGSQPRKRKLIELVKTNASVDVASEKTPKPKAIKKKARTLTDLATSAYAPREDVRLEPTPILQYLSHPTSGDGFTIPPRPRSKSPSKRRKGTAEAPILLSPESALKQVINQDFVFGTSSQLAREQSPTLLRDIHAAMQASNCDGIVYDAFDDPLTSPSIVNEKPEILTTKSNLWSAASRDTKGELMDIEMVNLVESPVAAPLIKPPKLPVENPSVTSKPPAEAIRHEIVPSLSEPVAEKSSKVLGPVEAAIRLELLCSPSSGSKNAASSLEKSSLQAGSPSKPAGVYPCSNTMELSVNTKPKERKRKEPKMPDFDSYTTLQLTKKIAKNRLKPIKSRAQMIIILERCWESEQRIALKAKETNTLMRQSLKEPSDIAQQKEAATITINLTPQIPSEPILTQINAASQVGIVKKPRGRPRKDSTSILAGGSPKAIKKVTSGTTPKKPERKFLKISDEISDSDAFATPSPPRRRSSQLQTTPLPLRPPADSPDSSALSPGALQIQLFKHVTRAVLSASPSKDSQNPSWHEKILLYDPIILEDLAAWLNSGALTKVGWDEEVSPFQVKKWCESKSICCLWKANLRGEVRSRY